MDGAPYIVLSTSVYVGMIFTIEEMKPCHLLPEALSFPQEGESSLWACQATCHAELQSSGLLLPLEGRVVALGHSYLPRTGFPRE